LDISGNVNVTGSVTASSLVVTNNQNVSLIANDVMDIYSHDGSYYIKYDNDYNFGLSQNLTTPTPIWYEPNGTNGAIWSIDVNGSFTGTAAKVNVQNTGSAGTYYLTFASNGDAPGNAPLYANGSFTIDPTTYTMTSTNIISNTLLLTGGNSVSRNQNDYINIYSSTNSYLYFNDSSTLGFYNGNNATNVQVWNIDSSGNLNTQGTIYATSFSGDFSAGTITASSLSVTSSESPKSGITMDGSYNYLNFLSGTSILGICYNGSDVNQNQLVFQSDSSSNDFTFYYGTSPTPYAPLRISYNSLAINGNVTASGDLSVSNGTSLNTLTTSGSVGIGTTTPSQALDVSGNITTNGITTTGYLVVTNDKGGSLISDDVMDIYSNDGSYYIKYDNSYNFGLYQYSAKSSIWYFDYKGNINTSGSIYLGTSNDQKIKFGAYSDHTSANKIDLYGNGQYGFSVGSSSLVYSTCVNHNFYTGCAGSTLGYAAMQIVGNSGTDGTAAYVNINNTTNTTYSLYVSGNANIEIQTSNYLPPSPDTDSYVPNLNGINIENISTTGTGSSSLNLRVQDTTYGNPFICFERLGNFSWTVGLDTSDLNKFKISPEWGDLATNTCLTITKDGYVGIGTSTPTQVLDVSGNVNVTGSITANGSITPGSDYRIKEDIKDLSLDEYTIDNLRPVYFKFKKDGKESIGLIAHELQEQIPFLVEGEKDGDKIQTVNYMALVGLLIKEIQELKKEVKILKQLKAL
jgi:hypothetical protein